MARDMDAILDLHDMDRDLRVKRGLVVDIVRGLVDETDPEKGRKIQLQVGPRLEDEPPLRRAPRRDHRIDSAASFVTFATRYGSIEASLIMADVQGHTVTLCIDEESKEEKEYATYNLPLSGVALAWQASIKGELFTQDSLLNLLRQQDPYITGAESIMEVLSEISTESITKRDRKLDTPDGTAVGVSFSSALTGKATAAIIPTSLQLCIPLLAEDMANHANWMSMEVRLDLVYPRSADESLTFRLRCCEWDACLLGRVRQIVVGIESELAGWIICYGAFRR